MSSSFHGAVSALLLLGAVAVLTNAQEVIKPCEVDSARICMDIEDVVLDEGEEIAIKFRLPLPILCEDDPWNCTVDALITNSRPDEIYLSHCHVHWNMANWFEEQTVYVRGVEDFVDDGEKKFELVMEPIISRAKFYQGHKPNNIKIKTKSRPTATCSSTTDPNYNTFDNARYTWNFAGAALLWSAPHRDFEVQTMVNGGRNCATAIRQGCDVFVFDSCSNRLNIKSHIQSDQDEAPSFKEVSDNTYIVSFPKSSGSEVKIVNNVKITRSGTTRCGWSGCFTTWTKTRSEWQDIYVQAPGTDFGYEDTGAENERPRTTGLCGSFDNDRSNDPKSGNAFVIPVASSLFRKTPACVPRAPPPKPDHSKCTYIPRKVVRPILLDPNAEDITDLVKSMPLDRDDPDEQIIFEPEEVEERNPTPEEIADVEEGCFNAISNSPGAQLCESVGTNLTKFVEGCVQDILLQEDEELKFGAVDAMLDECKFLLAGNIDLFDRSEDGELVPSTIQTEIINGSCPHLCNFNGVCTNGTCICDDGWTGPTCNVDVDSVPNLIRLSPHGCDSRTGCKPHVMISGEDFLRTNNVACKFGASIVPAEFIADIELRCTLPDYVHQGASEKVLNVSITVDGENFTDPLPFVHYDSKCQVCRSDGQCMRRDGTCAVDNKCYLEGEVDPSNPCKTCQPDVNSEAFTFDLTESREKCKSTFDTPLYIAHVPETSEVGEVVLECKATNELVADMENNELDYDLSSEATPYFGITTFQGSAYIRIAQALDYETKGDYSFDIFVRDSAGNVDTSSVTIHLLNINEKPLFAKDSYTVSLNENDVAQELFVVEATDDDSRATNADSASWGKIEFSLVSFRFESEADLFTIDPQSGAVRTTGPLDYEEKQVYHFAVRATDGDLTFETVPVVVTVINQNEPPTFVSLSENTVEENAAVGTVVGVFHTEDPDPDSIFSYSFLEPSAEFGLKTEGKKTYLITKEVLDYESGANYEINVQSADDGSPSFSTSMKFGVIVLDRNDAPETIGVSSLLALSNMPEGEVTLPAPTPLTSIPEDQPVRSVLATLTAQDADKNDFHTFELRDDDNGFFGISQEQLILMKPLDYETDKQHTILIIAKDSEGAESPVQPFTFQITDVQENPKHITLNPVTDLKEDAEPGTTIGTISAIDDEADQPMTLSLQEEFREKFELGVTTCAPFETGTRCEAELKLKGAVDYEEHPFENVVVMAVSNADPSQKSQIVVPIPVVDSNDAPQAVGVSNEAIEEQLETGTKVAELSTVDEDDQGGEDKYDYELLDNKDLFEIRTDEDGNSGIYFIGDENSIDYESMEKKELTFNVKVTDHGTPPLSREFPITLKVEDKPISLVLNGNELEEFVEGKTPEKVIVGTIDMAAYDTPDQVPTFSISNDPTGLFKLEVDSSGTSASLVAHPDASVDYESLKQTSVEVSVGFTSKSGQAPLPTVTKQFDISVTPQNESPTFDNLDHIPKVVSLSPNMQPNTYLFTVSASDPDGNDHLTYSICDGDSTGVLKLNPATGDVFIAKSPVSSSLPKNKEVQIEICVSDGKESDRHTITVKQVLPQITLVNNPEQQVADNQQTKDLPTQAPKSDDSTATTAAIVGVVFGVLILLLVVAFFMFRHQDTANLAALTPKSMAVNPVYSKTEEPIYTVTPGEGSSVQNPVYAWHMPNYAREDCYDILNTSPVGSFVVRNYAPTPGWYMLHTKMAHSVRDDKIRLNPDGTLQLVNRTTQGTPHPTFPDLAALIAYYSNPSQTEFPVVLQAAQENDDLYDAVWERHVRSDKNAPALPIKDSHREMIEAVALASDDIYSNTEEARLALGPGATETLKKKQSLA